MAAQINTISPSASAECRVSYQQFLELDDERHVEWVDGRIIEMAPVTDQHALVKGFAHSILRAFVEYHKLGVVLDEPFQMKTGPDLPGRSPDSFFLSNANMGRQKHLCLEGPADLVVEVISPGSARTDRVHKFQEYQVGGVLEYWILDPDKQSADFFLRDDAGKFRPQVLDAAGVYRSRTLTGLWVRPEWFRKKPMPSMFEVLREWGIIR